MQAVFRYWEHPRTSCIVDYAFYNNMIPFLLRFKLVTRIVYLFGFTCQHAKNGSFFLLPYMGKKNCVRASSFLGTVRKRLSVPHRRHNLNTKLFLI